MEASPSWRLLPAPAARVLFGALAVDERLRCREVCTGWRDALDCDPPTWEHLDMRPAASLSLAAQGHMLRAAAARARGKVRSLALAFPSEPLDEATLDVLAEFLPETDPAREAEEAAAALRSFLDDRLLPVLRENSATLQQLFCVDRDGKSASMQPALVRELLGAAPQLRELHCNLSRSDLDQAEVAELLRREGPFAPVRLNSAFIYLSGADDEPSAALKAHVGLQDLFLIAGPGAPMLAVSRALDAAAGIRVLALTGAHPVCCGALARLVRTGALRELRLVHSQLSEARAGAFAAALRDSRVLELTFLSNGAESNLFRTEALGVPLLKALKGHATLKSLAIELDAVPEGSRAAVGVALAALVAADTDALTSLSVHSIHLGEDAAQPLLEALRFNKHLEVLDLTDNQLELASFAKHVDAIRSCASLRELRPLTGEDRPLARVLQMLERMQERMQEGVAETAAAREGHAE